MEANSLMTSRNGASGKELEKIRIKLEKAQIQVKSLDLDYQKAIESLRDSKGNYEVEFEKACDVKDLTIQIFRSFFFRR